MGRFKTIQYAVNQETGIVISRVGSEVAVPVLQYDKMTPENNFETLYELQRFSVHALAGSEWNLYKWTRYIPLPIKNHHREFWGMKPLKRRPNTHELTAVYKGMTFTHAGHTFTVLRAVSSAESADFDYAVLKDEQKRKSEWNLSALKIYIEQNPHAIV